MPRVSGFEQREPLRSQCDNVTRQNRLLAALWTVISLHNAYKLTAFTCDFEQPRRAREVR